MATKKSRPAARPKAKARPAPKASKKKERAPVQVISLTQPCPEEKFFILANGKPLKHVGELADILADIEDHVFKHHVTADKNDFANWVRDVFHDLELARKIVGVNDKQELQLVLYKHVARKALGK